MLMQPNLVLIILKYLEKRCPTYIWEMFYLYGLKIQKLQGIIEFLEKKNYINNKTVFYATSILCNVLESYLYILREV